MCDLQKEMFWSSVHSPDGTVIWISEACSSYDEAKEVLSQASEVFDLGPHDWAITAMIMEEDAPGGTGRPQVM